MSDVDFDRFTGQVDVEDVYRATVIMYRCPKSDHIWAFWDGFGRAPRLYGPAPLPDGPWGA